MTIHPEKSSSLIRVRFAPSPTGSMHIGNARVALFNWLFARHYQGAFLLRIEDTDFGRSCPDYTQIIFDSLAWLGISSDEPPVIQSQRITRHHEIAQKLLEEGKAYRCYCTVEELRARLGESAASDGYARYDERCRNQVVNDPQKPYVIRFKVPDDATEVTFDDLVRGPVTFKRDQLDDFIIVRSDGTPMYNFVVVVDDADMRISHVIRGEDHISNTPKQLLLYQAAGFNPPFFAHLPMILGPHGNRLSKRDGAVGVLDYKRLGFLASAVCNYLVRLGWAHGDQEIFSQNELVEYFSLEEVGKKSAVFDPKKLEWLNGFYIRHASSSRLLEYINDYDASFQNRLKAYTTEHLDSVIRLYQDRSKTLAELVQHVESLLAGPATNDLVVLKTYGSVARDAIIELAGTIASTANLEPSSLKPVVQDLCKKRGLSFPELAKPLRIALTGKVESPGIYELIAALGKDTVKKRLDQALSTWN